MLHGATGVMRPQLKTRSAGLRSCLLLLACLGLAACRSPAPQPENAEAQGITLLEDNLLSVIELEAELDAVASGQNPDPREVQRLFQQVAREYQGIIARNDRHLESRLLYGKLLMRYGDSDGARDQFLIAAKLDPEVAVIHQQLSTYFAEQGDYTRALAYALNAIEFEPETAAYHFALGQLLVAFRDSFIGEGVFSEAQLDKSLMDAFRTAAELEPETLPLQFRYGEAFYDISDPDWETALSHWTGLSQHGELTPLQRDAVRLHRVRCLLALEMPVEARALAGEIDSPQLRPSLAEILNPETK